MLRWRLIIGAALVVVVAAGCVVDQHMPGVALGPLALALAWLAADEILRMARALQGSPHPNACRVAALLPPLGGLIPLAAHQVGSPLQSVDPLHGLLAGLVAGLALVFAVEMHRLQGAGRSFADLATSLLALVYAGGLIAVLVALRQIDTPRSGLVALASVVLIVKSSDIGQYVVGRLFGEHKLAPRLSPGKTWEGLAGGIATACAIAVWAVPKLIPLCGGNLPGVGPAAALAIYAALLAVAGVFGDLAESMLKREAQLKDSSDWLPGFGGVLDLLDSLLFAGPVAYLLWATGLVSAC